LAIPLPQRVLEFVTLGAGDNEVAVGSDLACERLEILDFNAASL
jgi:hypothetical protein